MSKSVLALADNCIDVYPDRRRYYETGNAVDFALSLRAQGQPVSLMTIFGNDLFAASIRALLEERGVDCSHSLTGEKPTSFSSMTLVDGVDRRHLAWEENVLADFTIPPEEMDYVRSFDVLFADAYTARLWRWPQLLDGGRVVLQDFNQAEGGEGVERMLPRTDYAFFSRPSAGPACEQFLRRMQARSGRTVVAMAGAEGSVAYDGRRFYHQAALPARVVNTVGAGDSFMAGFAYGVCRGWPVERCLERGAQVAARIIARFEPFEEGGVRE